MSAVAAAAAALEDALKTVDGLRVYPDPGASVDPPGVVIGPPSLRWTVFDVAPSEATFQLYVVTRADDRALERLWDLVPLVAAAVATYDRASMQDSGATPGAFNSGGTDLPAYVLNVDVALI